MFDREWDALIVLDACRVDALSRLASEFEFLGDVDSVRSVGSTSGEWMAQTFDRAYEREIQRTAMVTANVHSETVLREGNAPPQWIDAPVAWPAWDPVDPAAFSRLEEVWEHGWDDDLGTVPPRRVTDSAITIGREEDHDRLIVHYLQPHAPYLERNGSGEVTTRLAEPLDALQSGHIEWERAWEAYLENLRVVLSEVELLVENLDAERVILTADHGEAFGELGFYEHPVSCPHPAVKRVPWVEMTASDQAEYVPSATTTDRVESNTVDQLEALGYV